MNFILLVILMLSRTAMADADIFESAATRANAMRSNPSVNFDAFPTTGSKDQLVDPVQLYQQFKASKELKPVANDNLLIFVSASMPKNALIKLGEQAKAAGAVLVIRGLVDGLDKGGWKKTMDTFQPVAKTGAAIKIHPQLFRAFEVAVVPTFVLVRDGFDLEACQSNQCAANALRATGDVSLDYVLEEWKKTKTDFAQLIEKKQGLLKKGLK